MPVTSRLLPGFRFETQPPPARDVLPRMDVAVFVGFAASGPLHVPVVIEDPANFAAIFGADLPLAWNRQRGEQVYAHLGLAVRAFFRCGGRRCYVIRVAGEAQMSHFPLAGIAQAVVDPLGNVISITPAIAQARSEGSWSDGLRVSTALLSRAAEVVEVEGTSAVVVNGDVAVGDLLHLTYRDTGFTRLIVVNAVEATKTGGIGSPPSPRRAALRATVKYSLWLAELDEASLPIGIGSAVLYGRVEGGETLPVLDTCVRWLEDGQSCERCDDGIVRCGSDTATETTNDAVLISLQVPLDLADAPPAGSMITVDLDAELLLLSVLEVRGGEDIGGSPTQETIWITCTGVRWLKTEPTPDGLPFAERLTFELRARPSVGNPFSLADLAFSLDHPRSWNGLPPAEQEKLQMGDRNGLPTDHQWFSAVGEHETVPDMWKQVAEPRFPLAGGLLAGAFTFPYAISVLPEYELLPYPTDDDALTRDGLASFETNLFLDEALAGTTAHDLAGRADYLRYLSPEPRALKGIHAALAIEEATLIAVPDALHPGWIFDSSYNFVNSAPCLSASAPDKTRTFKLSWKWKTDETGSEPVFTLEESPLPDFSEVITIYSGTDKSHTIDTQERGDYFYRVRATEGSSISNWSNPVSVQVATWSQFLDCGYRVVDNTPCLGVIEPDAAGTFTLSWDWEPDEPTDIPIFTLEEAVLPDFNGAITLYIGAAQTHIIYGRARGDYFYRVRGTAGGNISDWSNGVGVRVAPGSQWTLNEPNVEAERTCLTIHRALVRMCAARGDIVAVLAMPEHFREDEAIEHARALTPFSTLLNPDDLFDFPLSFAEVKALSYAALYHPWLYARDGAIIRSAPPDGTMCGMIARRAIERGAWIAPANEPIQGVLALTPPLAEERWLELLEAQINIIKPSPHGYIAQAADTLSLDEDLRPLNVRRLLILLRRLVLRRGAQYVFEPFDDVFRRMVQRGLESVLEAMYARGAFAGRTSSSAFQIVPRSTPQDVEQGRFIMDLRVAPSLPMEFLTVRLVQSGDRSIVSEER